MNPVTDLLSVAVKLLIGITREDEVAGISKEVITGFVSSDKDWYSYAPISGNPTIELPAKSSVNPTSTPALIAGEPASSRKSEDEITIGSAI